ncbi:hypothetical protein [Sphingomonas sp. Leaf257]|jgi:uncharacterized protein (DUF1800 family)|uniref:hypothetical protein n=1 Tax=Sphingomonas sp. Leaf257 TaxID=1736309 RepID=UPI0006FBE99E|nr:hypothetical protein [Sphingomonas sp. Leaf257]KQO51387.1 hypothetical protein ASF14_07760 [Sphingomonas sp. Leaf257]
MPMLDTDELLVALAMTRCARDHLARQLPHNFVQDSPEQMALLQRMNMAFMQISVAAADMALALKQHMQPTIDIEFATGGQTA